MNKKLQYKILTMIVVFIGLLILMQCNVFASSLSISASKGSVAPGESFSVTVTVSGGSGRVDLSASNGTLSSSRLELLTKSSETVTCTAGNSGTITITATGDIAESDGSSEETKSASTSVAIVVPEKPEENPGGNTGNQGGNTSNPGTNNPEPPQASNNANLKMLGVTTYDFSGFKKNVYEYKVKDPIPNDVTSVSVYATTEDSGATYTVSGNTNLKVGTNTITVTVTAADKKTKKDYIIRIERKAANEEEITPNVIEEEPEKEKEYKGLKSIILDDNFDLSPEFKTNIYSYKLKITGDLATVPLKANAFDENAKVTITGNEDLVDGENLITIEVTFDDSDTRFVYKITVYKNVEEKEETKDEIKTTSAAGTTKDKGEGMHAFTVAIIVFVVVFIVSGGITFLLIKERNPKSPWGDEEDEDVEKSEDVEEKVEFKKANINELKEDKFEEFSSPRGKGRH